MNTNQLITILWRSFWPASKYVSLYDDVTFDPPANFFDDYENRGTAAKEQEMEIDGHARWGHDFKMIVKSLKLFTC